MFTMLEIFYLGSLQLHLLYPGFKWDISEHDYNSMWKFT